MKLGLKKRWEARFLRHEKTVAIVLATGFAIWGTFGHGWIYIDTILAGNRGAVYGALATIFGALFGFVITAFSIALGFSSDDRLSILRNSKQYHVLWDVFLAAIYVLSIATLISVLCLIFDRDRAQGLHVSPHPTLMYLCLYSALLSVFRLARCVWVLKNLVEIMALPKPTPTP